MNDARHPRRGRRPVPAEETRDDGAGAAPPRIQTRRTLRRGIVILPSAFTVGNLFFGMYAVVAAMREEFALAGWFIVAAATLDLLDGRIARFTRTGSAFGAQLDSLTDAVSFGVAPAALMIRLHFSESDWGWMIGFFYLTAVVGRLARFTVEQGGEARRQFHGLPSPAAAILLATHYPFSQTAFYQDQLATLPWPQIVATSMVLLSILMLSHVPYAMVPRLDLRTSRGRAVAALMAAAAVLALAAPRQVFYPGMAAYTLWGLARSVFLGLLERLPDRDPLIDEEDDPYEEREVDYDGLAPAVQRRDASPGADA